MMFQISKKVIILFILLTNSPNIFAQSKANLTISIENVYLKKGNLYINLFNSEENFIKTPFKKIKVPYNIKEVTFSNIPLGIYSVIVFQDLDDNKKLNKILFLPTEPYGTSNNYSGYPSFKTTFFEVKKDLNIFIKLKN